MNAFDEDYIAAHEAGAVLEMPRIAQHGFTIKRFVDLTNWRAVPIFDLEIESVPNCPIDGAELDLLAALVGRGGDEIIRIGHCPSCGLVTYIDRPTPAACERYYRDEWMGETAEEAYGKAASWRDQKPGNKKLAGFAAIPVDRQRPAIEIGIGYGSNVAALKELGYTDIRGLENCAVRAEATQRAHDIPVALSDFCEWQTDDRFALVNSHHVLEHVHDPDAFVARCAEIQGDGDWLVLSVPHFNSEPSVGVLLFWPHLQSFTPYSLAALVHKHGYAVEQIGGALGIQARKNRERAWRPEHQRLTLEMAALKLAAGLGLMRSEMLLTWQRDFDGASWEPGLHAAWKEKTQFPRRMIVDEIDEYVTEAPIEIQFPGRVEMLFK